MTSLSLVKNISFYNVLGQKVSEGAFNDLLNMGDLRQPDWAQSNVAALDFIKNKPAVTRSATIKIAASNATDKSKSSADYICDGVSDAVEVNAAIQSLSGTGGCIELSEGTFSFGAGLVTINVNNIWLKGQGSATIISQTSGGATVSISAGGNARVSDLAMDCADICISNAGITTISNCKLTVSTNFPAVVNGGSIILLGNRIDKVGGGGTGLQTNANIYPPTAEELKKVNVINNNISFI